MIFRPFLYPDTGCAAYLAGCGSQGLCAVVDPQDRDLDAYSEAAAGKGMEIAWVIDTHLHADHLSGARRLAARCGARYGLHRNADVSFPFEPLDDGQVIEVGNTTLRVVHTPGHTPESVCLVVTDRVRGEEPWFLFTGDTLFVGAVGRPDLPGDTEASARLLHRSVRGKLVTLPDSLEIYPAHFGGSHCGAGLSGKPISTLGFEKRWNRLLREPDEERFVEALSRNLPPRPAAMDATLRANQGRA